MDRFFRVKTVPLALSFPLGITPAGIFALPLPSKVRVKILPPLETSALMLAIRSWWRDQSGAAFHWNRRGGPTLSSRETGFPVESWR